MNEIYICIYIKKAEGVGAPCCPHCRMHLCVRMLVHWHTIISNRKKQKEEGGVPTYLGVTTPSGAAFWLFVGRCACSDMIMLEKIVTNEKSGSGGLVSLVRQSLCAFG